MDIGLRVPCYRHRKLGLDHIALGLPMPGADTYLEHIHTFAAEVLPAVTG